MESELTQYTVAELVEAGVLEKPLDGNHGGTHPKGSDFIDSGIPFIMASDMSNGLIDIQGCKFISKKQADTLRKGFSVTGDVLFSHKATIGRTALIGELDTDYVMLTPQVTYYRVKDKTRLNNRFLKYYFDSREFQSLFNQWAGGGSTRAYLGITGQLKLPIKLPNIKFQKAIAHILGSLDDKIELNRQMNETLESMAQALFKSWFVDFDPVIDNALAAGNPIPDVFAERAKIRQEMRQTAQASNKTSPSHNEHQSHFPSEFEYTEEMGWIPKGWEVTELSKLINIKHGFAFKGMFFSQDITTDILLTPGNFKIGGGFKNNKFKYYSGPVLENYVLEENDLVVSMTDLSKAGDTLGYPLLVPRNETGRYLHNQRLGKVEISSSLLGKQFFYRCFCSKPYRDEILANVSGSTVKHTSPTKIMTHVISHSGGCIEKVFEKLAEKISEKSRENDLNNIALSKLRDTLLPKLLSGELRIPDAEKLIEEA